MEETTHLGVEPLTWEANPISAASPGQPHKPSFVMGSKKISIPKEEMVILALEGLRERPLLIYLIIYLLTCSCFGTGETLTGVT